jgi:prepilin peptidase CpaA
MVMAFAVGCLWTLSLVGLYWAARSDIAHRILPDRLALLTAGCGIAIRLMSDPRTVGWSIGIGAVVLLALGAAAGRGWIGGGDAKLIGAVTLLVPPGGVAALLLSIAIGGGLLSGVYLVVHARAIRPGALPQGAATHRSVILRIASSRTIPYGVAIFAGAAFAGLSEAARWLYAIS